MVEHQVACYENEWVLREIVKAVDKQSHCITNTAEVETRIMKYVGKYIVTQDANARNKRYIIRLIYTKLAQSLNGHHKREQAEFFSDVGYTDDFCETLEYEPVDVLANVESALEIKETTVLLAKGDRRKQMILAAWQTGNTDARGISNTLASVYGGNPESHRKFIQRFKIECQTVLSPTAI